MKPPFISSLCIPDDLVDDESMCDSLAASLSAEQSQSKYFGLILSILLSSHYRYYHLSTKQNLLYIITFYFTHTEIFASNFACEKAFRILLRPIREAK